MLSFFQKLFFNLHWCKNGLTAFHPGFLPFKSYCFIRRIPSSRDHYNPPNPTPWSRSPRYHQNDVDPVSRRHGPANISRQNLPRVQNQRHRQNERPAPPPRLVLIKILTKKFVHSLLNGTINVISCYTPCKDGNARFTTVPLKALFDHE